MDVLTIVKRSPFVVPLACLATAAMVFISEASYWQAAGTLDSLGTMATARIHIQGLERNIVNAEAGQRAYRLSGGDSEARRPYDNAIIDIDESLGFLQRHYVADSRAGAVVAQLSGLIESTRSELAQAMHIPEAVPRKTSTEFARSRIGTERMAAIHALSAELLEEESSRVEGGRTSIYQTLTLSRIGVALLSALQPAGSGPVFAPGCHA